MKELRNEKSSSSVTLLHCIERKTEPPAPLARHSSLVNGTSILSSQIPYPLPRPRFSRPRVLRESTQGTVHATISRNQHQLWDNVEFRSSLVREVDGLGEGVLAARVEGVDGRVVALLVPQHEKQLQGAIQSMHLKTT